jgi:hypothetical protein
MTDYYLKFDDRQHMLTIFLQLNLAYQEDDIIHVRTSTLHYVLYEVGEILNTGGWHANLRVIDDSFDISPLHPYVVHPTHPRCVWA